MSLPNKNVEVYKFYLLSEQDFSRSAKSNIFPYHIPDIFIWTFIYFLFMHLVTIIRR